MKIVHGKVNSVDHEKAEVFVMTEGSNGDPVAFTYTIPASYKCDDGTVVGFEAEDAVSIAHADPHEGYEWSYMVTSQIDDKVFYATMNPGHTGFVILNVRLEDRE